MPNRLENLFETAIAESLVTSGGYLAGNPNTFDRELALDRAALLAFIRASQPKAWKRHETNYGAEAETAFFARFVKAVEQNGILHVLRHGWEDRGVKFSAVFWKPESTLNQTSRADYERNVLHCTRQLHYSPKNEQSVDIVLFLNGIPVVSMELKCQLTNQTVANAERQYRFDRSPDAPIFQFNRRVLVHFAVDLTDVSMTTRLDGDKTRFLPFNQGSGGAGNVGGAGNPPSTSHSSAYLWEEVLVKDRLLEILQKYIHLQKGGKKERLIFPRYHQLDVVTKLIDDARRHGAGRRYLIQHSAGSGKSNSIAWLAHRLAGLHNDRDEKIFKSVIIVTDRVVLDNQLQNTVSQFDHVQGVIQRVDNNSKQLKDAIESGTPIIITTLQKFPVIYKDVNSSGKRFAVIIDEAHSSQAGTSAQKLKQALADTKEILAEYAKLEYEEERTRKDDEDKMLDELAAHGFHKNLSFFAFTATPKEKTLQMFGRRGKDGKYKPFHVYSMRQAIEEGFILDVLKNYMTYNMYFHLLKNVEENPELDTAAGLRAIKNYESLHPHNIAQKTRVMLEHFLGVTRHKIGGKAKAMVVTASRLHAVRYLIEFRRQIREKGLPLEVLVAFSGEVNDGDESYTEEKLNRTADGAPIASAAIPAAFKDDSVGILVVAEKYQTGFDEPYLHTMFVDKKLSGVKAVQTLSRLNRTCPGKQDTFILDFVNKPDEIQAAFEPYYEETQLEKATDPNVVYRLRDTLRGFGVFTEPEVEAFYNFFSKASANPKKPTFPFELMERLRPARERYAHLPEDARERFKSALSRFLRIYTFITQITRMFDRELHKLSVFCKFLIRVLPRDLSPAVNVDGKVLLDCYRLERAFDGEITLTPAQGGVKSITGDAGRKSRRCDFLANLIQQVNNRYGTNWQPEDRLLLAQIEAVMSKQEAIHKFAKQNSFEMFMELYKKELPSKLADIAEHDEEFFNAIFVKEGVLNYLIETLGRYQYDKFRGGK